MISGLPTPNKIAHYSAIYIKLHKFEQTQLQLTIKRVNVLLTHSALDHIKMRSDTIIID